MTAAGRVEPLHESGGKAYRELLKRNPGWSMEYTGSGHVRLRHPEADQFVVSPSTPSDYRALKNTEAMMRRLLRKSARPTADQLIRQRLKGH